LIFAFFDNINGIILPVKSLICWEKNYVAKSRPVHRASFEKKKKKNETGRKA
jgi:hypothetical protein